MIGGSGSSGGSSTEKKFHPTPALIVMSSTKKERWIYSMYVLVSKAVAWSRFRAHIQYVLVRARVGLPGGAGLGTD